MNMRFIVGIILGLFAAIILASCSLSSPETVGRAFQPINTNTEKPLGFGLQPGERAPEYSVMTTKGMILGNGSFDGPVLLYFFASWCPYCKEDFEVLSQVYPKYEESVSILAIDMDLKEDAEVVDSYAARFPALDGVWFAQGNPKTLATYQIKYTTTKYALDKNGNVLYAGSGAFTEEQWRVLLEAMKKS